MSCVELAGIVIGSITAIGVFLGPMLTGWWQSRRRSRLEKLRVHFEELKNEVITPMASETKERSHLYGRISFAASPRAQDKLESGEQVDGFKLHFPTLWSKWQELKKSVREHNTNYDSLVKEMANSAVAGTSLPYKDFGKMQSLEPSVSGDAAEIVWEHVLCPLINNRPPNIDLDDALIQPSETKGFWELRAGAFLLAVSTTREELEGIKSLFVKLTQDKEWRTKGSKLINNVAEMENKFRELEGGLGYISNLYIRYKVIEKVKDCPICKKF